MLSFAPGLAQVDPSVLSAGMQPMLYSRSPQFADLLNECLDGMRYLFQTKQEIVILTATGSAAMEAAIVNFLKPDDHILLINSGSFAQRWQHIAEIFSIRCDEFLVPYGEALDINALEKQLKSNNYKAVLLVAHESSVGTLFDVEAVGRLTKQNNTLFMVNAISTICADPFFMDKWHVDVAILSSHKALALPPGLAFVAFNDKALLPFSRERKSLQENSYFHEKGGLGRYYLNLQYYLDFQQKGQTPFSIAVNLLLMLQVRIQQIKKISLEKEIEKHQLRAKFFRKMISKTEFKLFSECAGNALTAIECPKQINAKQLVDNLAKNTVFIGSAAPEISERVFRVSHMGFQVEEDVTQLLAYLL